MVIGREDAENSCMARVALIIKSTTWFFDEKELELCMCDMYLIIQCHLVSARIVGPILEYYLKQQCIEFAQLDQNYVYYAGRVMSVPKRPSSQFWCSRHGSVHSSTAHDQKVLRSPGCFQLCRIIHATGNKWLFCCSLSYSAMQLWPS